MLSPPTGVLRLRHIGTANDGPARIWIEETGVKRVGQVAEFWALQALPTDQVAPNGQAVAGSWAYMKLDCAAGTAAARRAVIINSIGATLLDSGTLPDAPNRPNAGSTPAKLLAVMCTQPLQTASTPLLADAQSATQAIAWTRNPGLGRPSSQTAGAQTISLPSGPLALKDLHLDQDKTDGFFDLYWTLGNQMASTAKNVWVLMVSKSDRSIDINGRPIMASARWSNWVSNCARNELTIREAGLVGADGQITRIPAQSLPRPTQVMVLDRPGTQALMPAEPEAQILFKMMCPDMTGVMMGAIKRGLEPVTYTSASAAIQASRRARSLTGNEPMTAISCIALARATLPIAGQVTQDQYANIALQYRSLTLKNLLEEALGGRSQVPEPSLATATARWANLVNRAKETKDGTAIKAELDRCIATLPIGVILKQFSD